MVRKFLRGRAAVAAALAVVLALAFGATALASNYTPPALHSPRAHQVMHVGHVRLVVFDPGLSGPTATVYVAINRHKRLNQYGYLIHVGNVAHGFDFLTLKRWRGHPGYWTYTPGALAFPGFWATTPGTYYWQASKVAPLCQAKGCQLVSAIHTFRIAP